MARRKKVVSGVLLAAIAIGVFIAAFALAYYTLQSPDLQEKVATFGYPGAFLVAFASGFNVLVPVPIASVIPIFTAAGLYLPYLIVIFAFGTVLADMLGYLIGYYSRDLVLAQYPKLYLRLHNIYEHHHRLLIPTIFLFAAFFPLPNEALVIPLAQLGVRWQTMALPLFFGNLLNQTIYAYGFHNLFVWLTLG